MSKLPSLAKTAAAIAIYDARLEEIDATIDRMTDVEMEIVGREMEDLASAVGRAYGEETKDRNNPTTCAEVIRPGPIQPTLGEDLSFVRQMVALWKAESES